MTAFFLHVRRKNMRMQRLLFILCLLIISPSLHADRFRDLEKRIKKLEKRQAELTAKVGGKRGRLRSFIAEDLSLGGFFESNLKIITGPDTDTQVSAQSQMVGINLSAELTDKVRFVNQDLISLSFPLQNEHNNPSHGIASLPTKRTFGALSFGATLAQGYVEYAPWDSFKIQGGMGYVPFGIAFQEREPVLFLRRGGPQMIRSSSVDGVTIAAPFWTGVHFLGRFDSFEKGHWGYDFYTATPQSDPKMLGGGGRFWWMAPQDIVTLGTSFQIANRGPDTYQALGTDLAVDLGRFGANFEYARNFSSAKDPWSFYLQPYFELLEGSIILHADVDYLNNTVGVTSLGSLSVADPYQKWEYGGGVNWLPLASVRMRLLFLMNDYVGSTAFIAGQNRNYFTTEFSVGLSF